MFVISVKKLFDYKGNRLDKPEYKYFGYDRYAGSFAVGYPTWMSFHNAETFKTAEEAKKVYIENLHILTCNWEIYDKNSVRIYKVKFNPVEKLPWKEKEDKNNDR